MFWCPYARGAQEAFALPRNPSARPTAVLGLYRARAFVHVFTITTADKDAMQPLEPAFENPLRRANLHKDVISALRKEEIIGREMFVFSTQPKKGIRPSYKPKQSKRSTLETLAQVISLAEENKQKALKPEVGRQVGLHLDNTLSRRRDASLAEEVSGDVSYVAFGPDATTDQTHLRRPQRNDIRRVTQRKNFLLEREVAGSKLIVPDWTPCFD